MKTHYVITSREVVRHPKNTSKYLKVNNDEYLRWDGKETSQENLRVGTYSFENPDETGTLKIFPEDIDEFS